MSAKAQSRAAVIQTLRGADLYDALVVGGGIHGAALGQLLALNGFKVALLEKADYASATSSRSSKMAHGGLRYLEFFDFAQVREGVKAREALFGMAPHLVQPCEFLIPVHSYFERIKYKLGLSAYDLFHRLPQRRHRWLAASDLGQSSSACQPPTRHGCFSYWDGILDDARLTVETVLAARTSGAHCLNYAEVNNLERDSGGIYNAYWHDRVSGCDEQLRTRTVINCTGPWAASFTERAGYTARTGLCHSRGTHVLFSHKWDGPALFLPLVGQARYYFVWPHFAGTLVGTTEQRVDRVTDNPQPSTEELREIFDRLARDLPGSPLVPENAHYCFAGVRSLPLKGAGNSDPSRLSRKHIWEQSDGFFSLFGGKLTTYAWTAAEGLRLVAAFLRRKCSVTTLVDRKLDAKRAIDLFGRSDMDVIAAARHCIEYEQVEYLEDLMRRRLGLELLPGHGEQHLHTLVELLKQHFPDRAEAKHDWEGQANEYRERVRRIQQLVAIA